MSKARKKRNMTGGLVTQMSCEAAERIGNKRKDDKKKQVRREPASERTERE